MTRPDLPELVDRLERLRRSARPRILFASHAFGGGVTRHIEELAAILANDAEVLLLQPHLESFVALRWLRRGEELSLWLHAADEWDRLVELLEGLVVSRVHFHHVDGLPQRVLELPRRLHCAYDVTLHDYYPACPEYHLTGGDARFCGGDPQCQRCWEGRAPQWPLSIDGWRAAFHELLAGADRVIAPSADCARRIASFFPGVSPVTWSHPAAPATPPASVLRVLVPGAISPAKGFGVLQACARDAAERGLPLHFRVVGHIAKPLPSRPAIPLTISGEYRDGGLPGLLALERGDVIFFPAQCPETFSYTLSAALDTSLPIVATDLGAHPERLAQRANARIVRWNAAPAEINEVLLACADPPAAPAPDADEGMTFDAYRRLYVHAFRPMAETGSSAIPPLESRWLYAPQGKPLTWTFIGLVYDLESGRAIPLEDLERRAHEADERFAIAAAHIDEALARVSRHEAELAAMQARSERLASRAAAAEERLRSVEGSRSWRVTAPLRALMRWWDRST